VSKPAQPRPAAEPQLPFLLTTVAKESGSKVRRFAKPLILGVLAVDVVLGAIFVVHQGSGEGTHRNPASAMSIPDSSANDGTLVSDDAERPEGGVPVRVSVPEVTMRGNIVRMVPPARPAGFRRQDHESVLLQATVGRNGQVLGTRVVSGDPKLAKAATDAVKLWRYKPYLVNGQPADVETQITVEFNSSDNRSTR
jgi:TonB family protein